MISMNDEENKSSAIKTAQSARVNNKSKVSTEENRAAIASAFEVP